MYKNLSQIHSHVYCYVFYMQLHKTIPINYLQGELFQADVTCGATGGKLMFKFNGTRILSNRGSYIYIAILYTCTVMIVGFKNIQKGVII